MKNQKTYTVFSDPGHAWGCVEIDELQRLGIMHRISEYSYLDAERQVAYLEEDCDLPLFLDAKIKRAEPYNLNEQHTDDDIFIRELPRFDNSRAMLASLEIPLLITAEELQALRLDPSKPIRIERTS